MRRPVLFDKSLIERNLSFYKKRFNEIAAERTAWLDKHFYEVEALRYMDIGYNVSEVMTVDKIVSIKDPSQPYPTHIVSNLSWGDDKLEKLKDCLSFRLYRAVNTSEIKLIKELHSFIGTDGPSQRPKYSIRQPMLINEHVIFAQMNYVLVMYLDGNWAYDKTDLYTFGLDQRKQLKLNPDLVWMATLNKAANLERIFLIMDHLIKQQFSDLRCYLSNSFMASMVEKFIEINNDPNK